MKGLFLKDIRSLWKAMIVCIIVIMAEYPMCILFEISEKDDATILLMNIFIVIMCSVIPVLTLSDDDSSGFMKYAKVLPLKREIVIGEKYILSFCVEIIMAIVGVITLYVITNNQGILWMIMLIAFPISLIINGIILTCITKFGTQKALITSLLTFIIILFVIIVVTGYIDSNYNLYEVLKEYSIHTLIVGIVAYIIMYVCTVKIYKVKEY